MTGNYIIIFEDDNRMERNVARKGMVLEVPEHLLELVD
jgi:hypothetical protein